jgi:Ankyrin repeats (3 copies)
VPEEYRDEDEDAMRSLIHRAAGRGDVDTANRLLEADPSLIHDRNELQNEPLHEACWAKHLNMVRLLIERGADVNSRGDFGETPLHYAVRDAGTESIPIVALLLEAGADVEAKDERLRQNALGFALREFNDDLDPAIQLLRERGSSLGLEGAMILGDVGRVRELLSESEEEPQVELVRPVLGLAKDCRRDEIAQLIGDWLRQNAGDK